MLFVPSGGLGNRMRAIASAVETCRDLTGKLEVVWFRDPELYARFTDLFLPLDFVREARAMDYLLYRRPRSRNLGIPQFFQKMAFSSRIYAPQIYYLKQENFDFVEWARQENVYLHSYSVFADLTTELMQKLFRPTDEIQKQIDERCSEFQGRTIGVQVRRTDNKLSIEGSPLELFYDRIDADGADTIYLATDDDEVKKDMKNRYGGRVLYSSQTADRQSVTGMKDALVEMFILSRTAKIYGSKGSSFSEIASLLGATPLEVVEALN